MNASDLDQKIMKKAVELSRKCPRSTTAFSVGCIITDAEGTILAEGYSREINDSIHAEEVALDKLPPATPTDGLVLYSTMEPCSIRKSGKTACCTHIIARNIKRVVFGVREPATFVDCKGIATLQDQGIEVIELPDFNEQILEINRHLQ